MAIQTAADNQVTVLSASWNNGSTAYTAFKVDVNNILTPPTSRLFDVGTNTGTYTSRFVIDVSGSVGIGVTTPPSLLSIDSASSHTVNDLVFTFDSAGNYRNGISNNMNSGNLDGNKMMFNVCNTSTTVSNLVMTLTGRSRVGIGDTAPAYKFVVGQGETTQTGQMFIAAQLNSSGKGLVIDTNTRTVTDNSVLALEIINNAGGNTLAATVAGNVGIGTTVPGYPLHVYKSGLADGSTNTHLMFDGKFSVAGIDQNDMIGMSSRLENSGGGSQTTFNIGFSYQVGANAILLQPTSGYVGIGTNNPTSKLHVVSGDIRFDNTYGIIGATNTSGNVLRADGTRFVPAQLSYSDLSTTNMPVRTVSYTSITGVSGDWYPLFKFGATDTTGAVVCTLSTASHSSVTFAVNRGWPGSNFYSISVLNCVLNPNGGFPAVTEIRVIADSAGTYDAQVEVKLVWSSGPTTNVTASVMASPMNVVFAASLATTAAGSASPGVSDSVVLSNNMMRAKGNIIAGGSVGIGQTNPGNLLTVNQASNTAGGTTTSYGFMLNNQGSARLSIGNDGTNTLIQSWSSNPLVINAQGNNISLGGSAAGPNTAVGVGTPNARLHVQGSTTTTTPTLLVRENQAMANATAAFDVQNSSSTSLFFVSGSGNTGIGSAAVSNARLLVSDNQANGTARFHLANTNASGGPLRIGYFPDSAGFHITSNGNPGHTNTVSDTVTRDWSVRTAFEILNVNAATLASSYTDFRYALTTTFSPVMRIQGDGSVGIGTTTILARLHVSGSATASDQTVLIRAGTASQTGPVLEIENNIGTTLMVVSGSGRVGIGTNLIFSDVALIQGLTSDSSEGALRVQNSTANPIIYARNDQRVAIGTTSVTAGRSLTTVADIDVYGLRIGRGSSTDVSNTAVGNSVMSSATTSTENTAVGYLALRDLTTAQGNTAIGAYALLTCIDGGANTAVGDLSMYSITSGFNNTAVGYLTATGITTGSENTAIGSGAGNGGSFNTSIGSGAGAGTGNGNTTVGRYAGLLISNGQRNVAVGLDAGSTTNQGNDNIFIGAGSRALSAINSNSIVIGSGSVGIGTNTMVLGNSSTATTFIAGNVGIGTTSFTARFFVSGSSTASTPTAIIREGVVRPTGGVGVLDVQNSAGTSLFFVSGSGRIGIGTSTMYGNSRLQIANGDDSTATQAVAQVTLQSGSGGFSHFIQSLHANFTSDGNAIRFHLNTATTAGGSSTIGTGNTVAYDMGYQSHKWYTNGSESMRLSLGSVGIGTNSPSARLHVVGSTYVEPVTSTDTIWHRLQSSGGGFYFAMDNSAGSYWATNTAYAGVIYRSGLNPITLWTNDVERMRIDSTGSIGVGTTIAPARMFVTGSTSTSQPVMSVRAGTSVQSGGTKVFQVLKNDGTGIFHVSGSGDVFVDNGNLVIGTSGKGIDFSSTSNAASGSLSSELLDDYEEGTWTPQCSGSTAGVVNLHVSSTGVYTKVGRTVHCQFYVSASSITGVMTGYLRLFGLPFQAASTGFGGFGNAQNVEIYQGNGFGTTYAHTNLTIQASTNFGQGWYYNTSGAIVGAAPRIVAGSVFDGMFTYITDQ